MGTHGDDGEKVPLESRTTKAGRTLRNNRYRNVVDDVKQRKQLFTPEIKKLLKEWLVRRRRHPYPSRGEKRELAMKTGLTYMQICNWFANWRRKLRKNTEGDSWGSLMTGYNRQAPGNCERFSISSADSVWDEASSRHHSEFNPQVSRAEEPGSVSTSTQAPASDMPHTALLKWLESAARFRPRDISWRSTLHCWGGSPSTTPRKPRRPRGRLREEMDAAEALTFLSSAAGEAQL